MARITTRPGRGWLRALRRFSGVGVVLFALVLVVGTVRAHALAQVAGDDELCSAMGYGARAPAALPSDPSDLADAHHACCDLGLCLDASALPPSAPPAVTAPRRQRRPAPARPGNDGRRSPRRRAHNPRDPPLL